VALSLAGVPFNSSGREGGVARAPGALRAAGLAARTGATDTGGVAFAPLSPARSPSSGLLAEEALVSMVVATREVVSGIMAAGDSPIVLGGDCPVLLGGLAAARQRHGTVGLLLVDGHQDAYPPHASLSGEAADCEVYLALGLPTEGLPEPLRAPLVEPRQVTMLGPRDRATIARDGVASLEDRVALHSDVELIVRGPGAVAGSAARDLVEEAPVWWLHTDLDVLSTEALGAVDYPQPGGLSWDQLTEVVTAALRVGGCAGWSVTIYNPDLDPDGAAARRIVEFVAEGAAAWSEPARGGRPRAARPDAS